MRTALRMSRVRSINGWSSYKFSSWRAAVGASGAFRRAAPRRAYGRWTHRLMRLSSLHDDK
jgi:hypothetical protein